MENKNNNKKISSIEIYAQLLSRNLLNNIYKNTAHLRDYKKKKQYSDTSSHKKQV